MIPPEDEFPARSAPAEAGPFDPPPGFRFEEEFRAEVPRPRPAELSGGRHAARQRRVVSGCLIAAAICTAAGLLPVVQLWGLYILPLAYITWIGIGLGAIGIVAFLQQRLARGPYRYVEEGIPLIARIRALILRPATLVHGQPATYRHYAIVEYRDPGSGEIRHAELSSSDISAALKDRLTTTYRVGDYATAVYLPGKFDKSLRLYGFLDLRPGLGLVRRDREAESGTLEQLGTMALAAGFFGVLFWDLYAILRYQPLEFDLSLLAWPFAGGAVVLGGAMIAAIAFGSRRRLAAREARNARAMALGEPVEPLPRAGAGGTGLGTRLIAAAGLMFLGGSTAICWHLSANSLLDRSPPRYRPIQVDGMLMVTHKFIIREYKIKYHFLDGDARPRDVMSTPFEMARLGGDLAIAEVHDGRFGLPWVKAILPAPAAPGP